MGEVGKGLELETDFYDVEGCYDESVTVIVSLCAL